MKTIIFYIIINAILLTSCVNLDLNPLSEGSSENWYTSENQVRMSLNDLYRKSFWARDFDEWTDDWTSRSTVTSISGGTLTGEDFIVTSRWANSYKAIARANSIINNMDKIGDIPQEIINNFLGEARFIRACQYSYLITHWGDVPYFTEDLDIEAAFGTRKSSANNILQNIYEDFDFAIENLPLSYGGSETSRITKGAALAMKARTALYMEDWEIASNAAKDCIDLGIYQLYPDYGELFLAKTKNTDEQIFGLPNSEDLNYYWDADWIVKRYVIRNAGGFASYQPSWDLFCSYLCIDGLPIDESPLFNPQNPFENRDPRLGETMPEPGSEFLGYRYEPHPDSTQVYNYGAGQYEFNRDSRRPDNLFASFNGLVWKKGIDENWSDLLTDNDLVIVRYAEVLLMYAEAKIEQGDIDASVLNAMNQIRARAYGVSISQTNQYPEVTTTDSEELRTLLRIERRMEFAHEGLRYMDIVRWGIADQVLNTRIYGLLDYEELKEKVINEGKWFLPGVPEIDENGIPNLDSLYEAGLIKQLAVRSFPQRQYIWPIPSSEILINDNLVQNNGY
ncbi:RagB/SusD family nutrient uptake outer membrane protein [Membranihabitans maritimus]|uniref:RagB/SusD family nutrient uptake outer membrane protein n=1 Tax=Membranihabitans maritimus TaxID=2904244 RepID=UPI001F412068|nr:RagB/SusD family nutrient uptake outer membrane protein [Membranihabitans maritimus]